MTTSTVSASIVTYNDRARVGDACNSLLEKTVRYAPKLYIIDNGSVDGTVQALKDFDVTIIENGSNLGFGAAHNKMLGAQMGKYHFFVNPDILLKEDVISDMVDFFEANPDVVMACPKILNPDGSEQKLPKYRPTFKRLFLGRLSRAVRSEYIWGERELQNPCDIDFCTGCFFCIRSDVFKKLGGFDERYFMYLEDADLTLRAKQFGRVVIVPQISVTHLWERESAKSIKYLLIHTASCFKFLWKWRKNTK
ncbi:MAG: glycosyltransferase family 2 protein [Clostridia bacterium]|nr:glycosyltransferase family 2 protein [Clostridia bacterium]